jgi:hypothetical protein
MDYVIVRTAEGRLGFAVVIAIVCRCVGCCLRSLQVLASQVTAEPPTCAAAHLTWRT